MIRAAPRFGIHGEPRIDVDCGRLMVVKVVREHVLLDALGNLLLQVALAVPGDLVVLRGECSRRGGHGGLNRGVVGARDRHVVICGGHGADARDV
eukprot:1394966-Amorphochlora_amoeboformis.AAC.1